MTKAADMEREAGERKMSVPVICHDAEGQVVNIPENKLDLFTRRILLTAENASQNGTTQHVRSCSFRNRPRPKLLNVEVDRQRRSSLPSPSANLLSVSFENINRHKESTEPLRRVRSFKTTSKGGIVNRGDSFKRSTNSINSTGSAIATSDDRLSHSRQRINSIHSKDSGTAESTGSSNVTPVYKVAMLGDKGTGKTSLTNQFMTSEFVAYETNDTDEDEDADRHVTVLLNNEESTLEFVDRPMSYMELGDQFFNAFVIVYSATDRGSFQTAVDHLYSIRHELPVAGKPVILIANKIDLVRKRRIAREEGRSVAKQYSSKYAETSAALNHHVDEVLVGILSQIKLNLTPGIQMEPPQFEPTPPPKSSGNPIVSGSKKLLNKLFKKSMMKESSHSCENLFTA